MYTACLCQTVVVRRRGLRTSWCYMLIGFVTYLSNECRGQDALGLAGVVLPLVPSHLVGADGSRAGPPQGSSLWLRCGESEGLVELQSNVWPIDCGAHFGA